MRVLLLFVLCILQAAPSRGPALTPETAAAVFADVRALARKDDGRLWRLPLGAPVVLHDTRTGALVASGEAVPPISLERAAAGEWLVLPWPLPEDPGTRRLEIARAMFIRVRRSLGIPPSRSAGPEFARPDVQRWQRLERRALSRALVLKGPEKTKAMEDAMLFRAWRRQLLGPARAVERIRELNDGLAEYTALRLVVDGGSTFTKEVQQRLEDLPAERFERATGAAYGALLDERPGRWRQLVSGSADLGLLLREVWRLAPPLVSAGEAERRAEQYQ